jgi:hypothetical protein
MTIDDTVVGLVATFCQHRHVADGTRFTVVRSLEEAVRIATLKGPDNRWKKINTRSDLADFPEDATQSSSVANERLVRDLLLRQFNRESPFRRQNTRPWFLSHIVVSASHWARFSHSLRKAHELGLGWIVPANKEVLIVPRPTLRFAEGRPGVLHDDTGKKAIEWPDGAGYYFLHGTEFEERLYSEIVNNQLAIQEIASLSNADQRSIALQYMTFQQLVVDSKSDLLDIGVKGTSLYRLPLPRRIALDRPRGHGHYDYFIHMRDASHPEREFIEWVDPKIGQRRDAELCQAHAFGITLEEWLSIDQEG